MLIELSYLTTMLGHSACMQVLGEVGGSSQVLVSVFGWLQTLIMVLTNTHVAQKLRIVTNILYSCHPGLSTCLGNP